MQVRCWQCGEVSDGVTACPRCGAALTPPTGGPVGPPVGSPDLAPPGPPPNRNGFVIAAIAVLVVLIAGVLVAIGVTLAGKGDRTDVAIGSSAPATSAVPTTAPTSTSPSSTTTTSPTSTTSSTSTTSTTSTTTEKTTTTTVTRSTTTASAKAGRLTPEQFTAELVKNGVEPKLAACVTGELQAVGFNFRMRGELTPTEEKQITQAATTCALRGAGLNP